MSNSLAIRFINKDLLSCFRFLYFTSVIDVKRLIKTDRKFLLEQITNIAKSVDEYLIFEYLSNSNK